VDDIPEIFNWIQAKFKKKHPDKQKDVKISKKWMIGALYKQYEKMVLKSSAGYSSTWKSFDQ
jgi:hypothetical protein